MAALEQIQAWEAQDAADTARYIAEAEAMTLEAIVTDLEEGDGTPYLRDRALRVVLALKRGRQAAEAAAADDAEYSQLCALLPPGTVIAVPPSGLISDAGLVLEVVGIDHKGHMNTCDNVGVKVNVDGRKRPEYHDLRTLAGFVERGMVRTDLPCRLVRNRIMTHTIQRHDIDGATWWSGVERTPAKHIPDYIVVDGRGRLCRRASVVGALLKLRRG